MEISTSKRLNAPANRHDPPVSKLVRDSILLSKIEAAPERPRSAGCHPSVTTTPGCETGAGAADAQGKQWREVSHVEKKLNFYVKIFHRNFGENKGKAIFALP
ncbi:hypothetical protein [Chryseolinea lacunae]|uniref:Uncharacterized protein n=1 Tax=Chryseolinea lacunae TaxID=2801331 RepID=A0ABS1KWH5_9BACT|nr:hypothetical protein [Chryseolinea lacunae]MBL0743577.1 hypothetical protein [Chryseolinea lacunae]